jgi:ATPase subunit of ABC transporter with duplicated ATPase domains
MSGGSADVKGREEKRRKTEAQNLTFQSPGRGLQSVAEPTLLETGVRTMRSGRRIEQASAEQIEREEGVTEREGSRAERVLDLARQLKSQVMGEEDGGGNEHEDKSESGLNALAAKIVDAVESLEQQLEDEQNSTPRSVALLGQNGAGKSFLINLLLQVTQATEAEYGLNGVTAGGAAKDTNDIRLRTYLFHTLEGSLELRKCADQFSVTEKDIVDNIKIQEKHGLAANHMYMPKEERDKEEIILRKIKDARLGTAPNGDEKCGFMLPSAGGGESTTKIAIKARRV